MPLLKRTRMQNGRYYNDFLKWCRVSENMLMLQIGLDFKMGMSVAATLGEKNKAEKDISREEARLVKKVLWPVWYSLSWLDLYCQQGWGSGGCTVQLSFMQCEPCKAVTLVWLSTNWRVNHELQMFPPLQLDVSPLSASWAFWKWRQCGENRSKWWMIWDGRLHLAY